MKATPAIDDAALKQVAVQKWQDGRSDAHDDAIAVEVPVALEYNGIAHAVMLASPADLEDFSLGFSLSEGIIGTAAELLDCDVSAVTHGIQVQMRIPAQQFVALKEKRRNLTGRTGCGLCGAETLQQAIRRPPPVSGGVQIPAVAMLVGMAAMQARQPLQQHSGATHAAAWMNADGSIVCVREDVGRHNALDKLLGALALLRFDPAAGALLITSRASYEMVQKAATLGIGFIAAISAPTSLAVELAQQAGVTLVGFVRPRSHVVYAHGQRLLHEPD